MEFRHVPVLLDECIEALRIKPDGVYADGTLGGGGHAYAICERLSEKGRLLGFDQDEDAIAAASERLKRFSDRVMVIRSNFCNMAAELEKRGIRLVDGIMLDLGVSSFQLDDAERGFTYRVDAPLDMRMDRRADVTAADVVNTYAQDELYKVIKDYGEERYAAKIAKEICAARERSRITTTGELVGIIKSSMPAKALREKGHPARRTFQALRIEVNSELDVLKRSLEMMADLLSDNGRICVLTFHSLEDRIVKNVFRKLEDPCICPPNFPTCVCGKRSRGRIITRKAIVPGEDELEKNIRSHSARLRVFERRYDSART